MATQVVDVDTFEAFIDELHGRPAVRLVKLAGYGFVGHLEASSGVTVMAPQLRIVATAFDKEGNVLVRWRSGRRTGAVRTVAVEKIRGVHGEVEVVAKKEDLRKLLELEGYSVSDGEWTGEEIDRLMSRRAKSASQT